MRIDAMNKKKEKQAFKKDISKGYGEQPKSFQYSQQESYEPFNDEVPF